MFDFEKLNVFEKAVDTSAEISKFVDGHELDAESAGQLKTAINKTVVELARASAQIRFEERQRYFTNARACVHEAAAILLLINQEKGLPESEFKNFYDQFTQLSIMLYKLVQNSKPKPTNENAVPKAEAVEG